MHCLEVIEARNERAAGRECAHAKNDGEIARAIKILDASENESVSSEFWSGWKAGQREG